MKIYYVCRQDFEEDRKTKKGDIKFLTIDGGWSEHEVFGAVFRECHAKYFAEKNRLALRDCHVVYSIVMVK